MKGRIGLVVTTSGKRVHQLCDSKAWHKATSASKKLKDVDVDDLPDLETCSEDDNEEEGEGHDNDIKSRSVHRQPSAARSTAALQHPIKSEPDSHHRRSAPSRATGQPLPIHRHASRPTSS